MSSAPFPVTKNTQILNTSFDCLQFVVSNSSQFPIYLTTSGSIPNISSYDYVIQPNSDFTSPLVNTRVINVYTPATNFRNAATVTCYSYKHSEPNNTPYLSNQLITNNQNFPYTATPVLRFAGFGLNIYAVELPTITVDIFQPIYFNVSNNAGVVAFNAAASGGCIDMIQAGMAADNIVSVLPYDIGVPLNYNLFTVFNFPITVKMFSSNQYIVKNYCPVFPVIQAASVGVGTLIYYGGAKPPAFYYDLILHSSNGFAYDINIQLDMIDVVDGNNIINIFTQHLVGASIVGSTVRIIDPTLIINTEFRFLKLTVTNNLAGNWDISVNIFNYF